MSQKPNKTTVSIFLASSPPGNSNAEAMAIADYLRAMNRRHVKVVDNPTGEVDIAIMIASPCADTPVEPWEVLCKLKPHTCIVLTPDLPEDAVKFRLGNIAKLHLPAWLSVRPPKGRDSANQSRAPIFRDVGELSGFFMKLPRRGHLREWLRMITVEEQPVLLAKLTKLSAEWSMGKPFGGHGGTVFHTSMDRMSCNWIRALSENCQDQSVSGANRPAIWVIDDVPTDLEENIVPPWYWRYLPWDLEILPVEDIPKRIDKLSVISDRESKYPRAIILDVDLREAKEVLTPAYYESLLLRFPTQIRYGKLRDLALATVVHADLCRQESELALAKREKAKTDKRLADALACFPNTPVPVPGAPSPNLSQGAGSPSNVKKSGKMTIDKIVALGKSAIDARKKLKDLTANLNQFKVEKIKPLLPALVALAGKDRIPKKLTTQTFETLCKGAFVGFFADQRGTGEHREGLFLYHYLQAFDPNLPIVVLTADTQDIERHQKMAGANTLFFHKQSVLEDPSILLRGLKSLVAKTNERDYAAARTLCIKLQRESEEHERRSPKDDVWLKKTGTRVFAMLEKASAKPNEEDKFIFGRNLELSQPTGSMCAERSAISRAIASDSDLTRCGFTRIAILGDPRNVKRTNPCGPCGVCSEWLEKLECCEVIMFSHDLKHFCYMQNKESTAY